jgi:hypothetical protein
MWLYDCLPRYFETARIMTYGYNSSLLKPSGANLSDHRRSFMQALHAARADCPVRYSIKQTILFLLDDPKLSLETSYHLHLPQSRWYLGCQSSYTDFHIVNSDDVRVFVAPQRDARTVSICLVSDLQALGS